MEEVSGAYNTNENERTMLPSFQDIFTVNIEIDSHPDQPLPLSYISEYVSVPNKNKSVLVSFSEVFLSF